MILFSNDSSGTSATAVFAWLGLLSILAAAFAGLVVRHRRKRRRWTAVTDRAPFDSGPAEASMNLDRAEVRAFLERLVAHAPLLNALNIDECVAQIAAIGADAELSWRFEATHRGSQIPVSVRAVGRDADAVDLFFFTTPALASLIQQEMRAWVSRS